MDVAPASTVLAQPAAEAVTATPRQPDATLICLTLAAPAPRPLTITPPHAKTPLPAHAPEIVSAWPRCAQLAGAYLLGGLTVLLAVHGLSYLRIGTEPSEMEAQAISYRVDLNEASRAELLQLPGVGPSLADRIEEYRRTTGEFKSVEDLRKVKGIGPVTLERLRPFVTVTGAGTEALPAAKVAAVNAPKSAGNKLASLKNPINVNEANKAELQKLPGIGPKMSQRIIDEREKRPFESVNDLRRVSGIGPKTLEKLKPLVVVKGSQ